MRRRWILTLTVLAAVAALAGRLLWVESTADRVRQQELAKAAQEISRQAATAAIEQVIARMDRVVFDQRGHPAVLWVTGEEDLHTQPAPAIPGKLASASVVLAARDLEFSGRRQDALTAWRRIADDRGLPVALRAEGWAGLVSILLESRDAAGAAGAWNHWLVDAGPAWPGIAAAGLRIHAAGVPMQAGLLQVRRSPGFLGREGTILADRLDEVLGAGPVADLRSQEAERLAAGAWWDSQQADMREAVTRTGAWWTAPDGSVLRFHGGPLQVVGIDPKAFAEEVSRELAHSETLLSVVSGIPGPARPQSVQVASPWGGEMTLSLPDPPGVRRILSPELVMVIALLLVALGLGLLMRAAYRDRQLVQMQEFFVSGVSHEMRTPLSLIRLYGEMLQQGFAEDPEARAKAINVILIEERRLGRLIEDVLGLARIRRGTVVYCQDPVDLLPVVSAVVDGLRPRLERDGFAIELELPQAGVCVLGDGNALAQAISNLLMNAAKYSQDERWIGVRLEVAGGKARLAVKDHGIGMDPAQVERIFEPFYRIDHTSGASGVGIGLALVQHIVRGHAGSVEVDTLPGKGSTFTIVLPMEDAAHGQADPDRRG